MMTSFGEHPRPGMPRWQQLAARLQNKRSRVTDEELQELEIALQHSLRPVDPPTAFRDGLRRNLAVAAQRRYAGLEIAARRSYRQGILVGSSIGFLALILGSLLYLFLRPHLADQATE